MKWIDKVKADIACFDSSLEMVGYLDGIHAAAISYCQMNCPEEVCGNENKGTDISVYGMQQFLDSDVQ